jgi:hypothetical protein
MNKLKLNINEIENIYNKKQLICKKIAEFFFIMTANFILTFI